MRWKLAIILIGWMIILFAGFTKLFLYSSTPSASARPLPQWPMGTSIPRSEGLPTFVIFVHPHCPCSKATIGELEKIMRLVNGMAKGTVVFIKPEEKPVSWATGSLWNQVGLIPGVERMIDESGAEAHRFDAQTSGQSFLYDVNSQLVFSGGITPARGHMGNNTGSESILKYFKYGKLDKSIYTRVFGCSLRNPERAQAGSI